MADELTVEIIDRISKREGVDPLDLTPPLNDAVNTDALETLFTHADSRGESAPVSVEFTYRDYRVVVDSGEEISISKLDCVSDGVGRSNEVSPN